MSLQATATAVSIVDTSFKYFMVILDSVTFVYSTCCLISLKVSSFNISSPSAGHGYFRSSVSLLNTTAPMFSKFSVIYSTIV